MTTLRAAEGEGRTVLKLYGLDAFSTLSSLEWLERYARGIAEEQLRRLCRKLQCRTKVNHGYLQGKGWQQRVPERGRKRYGF